MIKRFFHATGVIALVCFSFFYTDKAADIIKKKDPIMKKIVEVSKHYEEDATDAMLIANNIVPGINGIEVDLEKSYEKMKRFGSFNSSLLVLKEVSPSISVFNTYDKYVIKGNNINNEVSILIKLDSINYLDNILEIINNKKINVTFFVSKELITDDLVSKLINSNNQIELLDNNYYKNDVNNINKILKSYDQRLSLCYLEQENEAILKTCNNLKMHTIKPSIITTTTPYKEIKEHLTSGSIIKLEDSNIVIKELNTIINYIKQRGYSIVTLSNLIKE